MSYIKFYVKNYEKVFIILGNHEFYHSEYFCTKETVKSLFSKFENVEFMDKTSLLYNNIRFIGCTLWSFVNDHDRRTSKTLKIVKIS
jgi:hypothetical protein